MGPTIEELAEDAAVYLRPRPTFAMTDRPGYVFEAGLHRGSVQRIRLGDVEAAVAWARAEAQRRGLSRLEWWAGWSATPGDLAERLLALGLVPGDPPLLAAMTLRREPPAEPSVDVRRIETLAEQLEALETVDWAVWGLPADERAQRRGWEQERFEEIARSGVVHHFAARLGGRLAGFGCAIDMDGGVALIGSAVLPAFRGRGVYRALVRARWDHAAARGTPLLVVQAGPMSAPVLEGLGFARHGDLRLFPDPGVASRHGDD